MVDCQTCKREMLLAPSCTTRLDTARYGSERHLPDPPPDRCRDCGVTIGGTHHPLCCIAQCARCGGQKLAEEHGAVCEPDGRTWTVERFAEICDVVERTYQGWPLDHDEADPYLHTSKEARAAALRILELLGIGPEGG
jgi:hypothetical protein